MWQRAWIWERRLKKGTIYCIRWHDDTGRVRTETVGPNYRRAERLRDQRQNALNAGALRGIRKVTYEQFVTEELEVMKGRIAKRSIDDIRRTLAGLERISGSRALANLTPGMVEAYFSERVKNVKLATANKSLRVLKASLNRAVKRGYLEKSPAADVKRVREPEPTIRVLDGEELGKLLSACPSIRWRALVALGVTTGMRIGEMLALRWEDVDTATLTLWVRNSPEHPTKSRRNRALALMPEVHALLMRLSRSGELVFHTRDGKPWHNNVRRGFREIVKLAGIKKCTLHDLRRSFVSHLAMAGVNEAVVQKLAGHSSITTTVRYYTGIMPQALRAAQSQLPFRGMLGDVSDTYHGSDYRRRQKTA